MKNNPEYYMDLALKLALKAKGRTLPNPMVGALVVKDGKIIGQGYHKKAGLAHAEIVALDQAGNSSKDASLYVTLEPCRHFGRTPPCVNRIIRSQIKEVFVGMLDPNPLNNGKGIAILKKSGIKVSVGYLEDELKELNSIFIKYISKKMPHITVKVAESLDGRVATKTGESKWITSDASRSFAHKLRGNFDAIVVGVNTVILDNPRLDAWFSKKQPVKVIVDSHLSTPDNANVFLKGKVIIATIASKQPGQETENMKVLSQKATILQVKEKNGQIDLKDMFKKLAAMEISSVLVEGGGTLIGSLFDDKLVDKVEFFISPKIIGGKDAISSVMGKGISHINEVKKLQNVKFRKIGEDFFIEGKVNY